MRWTTCWDELMRFQNAVRCLPSCVITLTIAYGGSTAKPNELGARESAQLSVNPAVTAVGSFAMDLYGQLAMENPGKNLFFSPYSMSSVLAMTAEGARGETAEQMGKVLGFPQAARDMALIHAGMLESNERLQSRQVPQELRDQLAATRKTLQAMGMVRAFSSTDAQFEGICASEPIYISKVCHKAFIEVTEQGTEAAAATAASGKGLGPAPPDQPFTPTFRADRPFLFAIRDVKTGTVLFLGRIMNPIH